MNPKQQVENLIRQKPLERLTYSEQYSKGLTSIIRAADDAALMYAEYMHLHLLMANNDEAALRLLQGIDNIELIISDLPSLDSKLKDMYSLKLALPCYTVAYLKKEPILVADDVHISPISINQLGIIDKYYTLMTAEGIKNAILSGRLYGGYMNGEWVGFIGLHKEGTMGMLHIFEKYRRRGMGYTLEALLINRLLERGEIPYGHVVNNNQASLMLQKRIGMEKSKSTISWLSKDEIWMA
ncbi:MAG: GNAT family N-acetyltransferase [Christensenellales bacterium]|jgi:tRNA (guanine37-N1)-methyltransferase